VSDQTPLDHSVPGPALLRSETIQAAARAALNVLPDSHGFMLLVVPFGDGSGEGTAQYVSNLNREDAIKGLKTLLFRWGINDDWMKDAQ